MKSLNMRWSSISTLAVALTLVAPLLTTSCTGSVAGSATGGGVDAGGVPGTGGSGTPGAGSGGSGVGSTGSLGSVPVVGPDGSITAPTAESAGTLVMRRLTNREYNNIVAELLGDTTAPGDGFPLDGPTATGFEAPTTVVDLNAQYYQQTADTLAETALQQGKLVIPCTAPATPTAESTCAGSFITTFGRRAYRRPVTVDEKAGLLVVFNKARSLGFAFNSALAQTAKAVIQSPNFLYHWELGPTRPTVDASGLVNLTQHQVASRLAMVLWESMPDETLLAAADTGALATPAQIKAQAQRMIMDPRATHALFNFHSQWLLQVNGHVTDLGELTKSKPAFTAAVKQALADEFNQFLTSVYTGDGTLTTLLTAPYSYINAALAPIYGVTATGTALSKVALDPQQRAGILTQTAFLAANADPSNDNPVRRGLAIYLNVLCGTVSPPPPVVPDLGPPAAGATTRQRFAAHSQMLCAQGCHTIFDPPGFAFENYDELGSYRSTEAGQKVDATGSFVTPAGTTIAFQNAVEMVTKLAQSDETKWCADRQWFQYMLGRGATPAERGSLEVAFATARANPSYSLRDMLFSLVTSKAFRFRTQSAGETL